MIGRNELIERAMTIQGWMSYPDLIALYELGTKYIKPGGLVVEIGVWKGLSTYILASICKDVGARLIAIDTFAGVEDKDSYKNKPENVGTYIEAVENPDFINIFLDNMKGLPVTALKGDSREMIHQVPDASCDLIFIDGNHNHPVIDDDIKNCLKKIKPDGMLCGHDHGNKERPAGEPYGSDISEAVDTLIGQQRKDWNLYSSPNVVETTSSIWIKL